MQNSRGQWEAVLEGRVASSVETSSCWKPSQLHLPGPTAFAHQKAGK